MAYSLDIRISDKIIQADISSVLVDCPKTY